MANFLTNPGFESDGDDWTFTFGTPTFNDSNGVKSGVKALNVAAELFIGANNVARNVAAGTRIYFSAWVKFVATANSSIAILGTDPTARTGVVLRSDGVVKRYDVQTGELLGTLAPIADANGFYFVHFSFLVPSDATVVGLGIVQPVNAIIPGVTEFLTLGQWAIDDTHFGDTETLPQVIYPENSPGKQEFQRSLVDPITGNMVKESVVVRDREGRNRDRAAVDALDHDDIATAHLHRQEEELPEP